MPKNNKVKLRLKVGSNYKDFWVPKAGFTLGRSEEADVFIKSAILSRVQLVFEKDQNNRWNVRDPGSTNGTRVQQSTLEKDQTYPVQWPFLFQVSNSKTIELHILEEQDKKEAPSEELTTPPPKEKESHDRIKDDDIVEHEIEINALKNRYQEIKSKYKKAKIKLSSALELRKENEKKAELLEQKQNRLKKSIKEQEREKTKLHSVIQALEQEKDQSVETSRQCLSESQTLQSETEKLRDIYSEHSAKVSLQQQNLMELNDQKSVLEQSLTNLNSAIDQGKLQEEVLNHDILSLEHCLEEKNQEKSLFLEKLDALNTEVKKQEIALTRLLNEETLLEESNKILFSTQRQLEEKLQLGQLDYQELCRAIQEKEQSRKSLQEEIDLLKTHCHSESARLESQTGQSKDLKQLIDELNKSSQQLSEEIDHKKAQLTKLGEAEEIQFVLERLESEIEKKNSTHRNLASKIEEFEKQKTLLDEKISQNNEKISTQLEKIQDTKNENEKAQLILEGLKAQLSVNQEKNKAILQENKRIHKKQNQIQHSITQGLAAKEKTLKELENFEDQKNKIRENLKNWEQEEKHKAEKALAAKMELLQQDLHQEKLHAKNQIQKEQEAWEKEKATRAPQDIEASLLSAGELFNALISPYLNEASPRSRVKEKYIKELRAHLESIFHSEQSRAETVQKNKTLQVLSYNRKASQKTKNYWRNKSVMGALGILVLGLLFLFPQIGGKVKKQFSESFNRNPASADQFVQKERALRKELSRFSPTKTRQYGSSYTDNILYLENYISLKTDSTWKEKWTLALNKFLQQDLLLSDRAIVALSTVENFLIKELASSYEKITQQTHKADINNMRQFENSNTPRLINILKSPENYQKFRQFEKRFYSGNVKSLGK